MPKRSAFTSERDTQAALICAAAFQRLAGEFIPKIGALQEEAIPPGAWPGQLGDLVACATNLAFAVELYLKALLTQLDLPVPPVHDLRKLYDAIPQLVKTLLETVYDTSWPLQLLGRRRVSITLARGRTPDEPLWDDYTKTSPALPDLLERSKDLFQSWRYVFESSQPEQGPYKFYQFEYGLLWCAAEAIRAEITVRLGGAGDRPATNPLAGESR